MARLGEPRIHHAEIGSTNEEARNLAIAGATHGTLVTADSQTAGRGRQGRVWSAPPKSSLLCSLVLREPPNLLPLAAGLAVADTVASYGLVPKVKWPNDVLVNDRKIAGILAEGRPAEGWAVLGIGLNVAVQLDDLPEELHATATTLGLTEADVDSVLKALLNALESRLAQSEGVLLEDFRGRDALLGREVRWSGGVASGVGAGIDGTGRLVVTTADGGRVLLDAGEVHLGPVVGS